MFFFLLRRFRKAVLIVLRGKMPIPFSTHAFSIPSMCFIARVSYISGSARSPPGKVYPADYGYIQNCIQTGAQYQNTAQYPQSGACLGQ
jgi:hypothetical protein